MEDWLDWRLSSCSSAVTYFLCVRHCVAKRSFDMMKLHRAATSSSRRTTRHLFILLFILSVALAGPVDDSSSSGSGSDASQEDDGKSPLKLITEGCLSWSLIGCDWRHVSLLACQDALISPEPLQWVLTEREREREGRKSFDLLPQKCSRCAFVHVVIRNDDVGGWGRGRGDFNQIFVSQLSLIGLYHSWWWMMKAKGKSRKKKHLVILPLVYFGRLGRRGFVFSAPLEILPPPPPPTGN